MKYMSATLAVMGGIVNENIDLSLCEILPVITITNMTTIISSKSLRSPTNTENLSEVINIWE